jgi:16S rRNA (uracil1498-N3)-methyltransferase
MDWIIEKAVELGVAGIQPLASQRCVTRLSAERAEKRLLHWNGIITSASEQCGRNRLAHLGQPTTFTAWASQQDIHRRIILCPTATDSLASWARHHPAQAITLTIGPEGGFTDEEHQFAISQGIIPLAMGPRVLRTETAGLAAIATLNAVWDNI